MQFLRVPAPFQSTVISLAESEQFTYRRHTIQSVTVDPLAPTHPYTLSGISPLRHNHQAFSLPELPATAPALVRAQAAQELARFTTPAPSLRAVPQHPDAQAVQTPPQTQTQRLADPSGPAPTVSQAHAIRANAPLSPPAPAPAAPVSAQLTPAAAPAAPARPGPGRHRA